MSLRYRFGARLRRGRVGVWYHRDYAAPALAASSRVEHIDLDRGDRIVARAVAEGLIRAVDVRTPPTASIGQLRRFHSLAYLERVEERRVLGQIFGVAEDQVDVATLLQAAKRAVGGTISALHETAYGRLDAAINLGGGFHHAEPEQGSGFCVFNDIGVGIADLRRSGWSGRVAIVDLDFHQGNGNTAAFAEDPSVFVFSIHGAVWSRGLSGGHERHLSGPVNDRRYLVELRTTLETALRRFRPRLIVYIAGADVLAGDRLGSFWLTPRGVLERDAYVAKVARALDAPLVVTLGGGYSSGAWQAHFRMTRALLTGQWRYDARNRPSLRTRFDHVASTLDPVELRAEDDDSDFRFTEADLLGGLGVHRSSHRFLDYYSIHGVELAFERYGIVDRIRRRGFEDLEFELDPSDRMRQVVRIRARPVGGGESVLLVEMISRRAYLPSFLPDVERLEVLFVEWLLLQDPSRSFTLARPPLPGQDHPGLGIARDVQELLVQACRRVGLVGLMDRPAHYHNALLCADEWRFVDPVAEGRFRAMMTILAERDLLEATRLVEDGALYTAAGDAVPWSATDHLLPVTNEVRAYFETAGYRDAVRRAKGELLGAGLHVRARGAHRH